MNRIFKLLLVAAVSVLFVGCYNDFMKPDPAKVYSKADFEAEGLKYISIKNLKAEFRKNTLGLGDGDVASWLVNEPLFTSGKVISNDRFGNVYKSLYIYDEDSETAIEIRLNTGNYIFHAPGQIVYVKLEDLVLGNYRGMVSIGTLSSDAQYSNGPIESTITQDAHVFNGVKEPMLPTDTLVVNSTNYKTALSDADLGRLVRFEDIESVFGQAPWGYQNLFPNYFTSSTTPSSSFDASSPGWEDINEWATWGAKRPLPGSGSNRVVYFYGSAWISYDKVTGTYGSNAPAGNYVIRTSGYAQFYNLEIPKSGKIVTVTAIYTKFTNGAGKNVTYQLTLNNSTDVIVK